MAVSDPAPVTPPPTPAPTSLLTAGGIILGIAALYFGRDFFIPFALAILLAFALSPIVNGLRHWSVPRVPAVLITVTIAFSVIGGLAYVVTSQLYSLAEAVPTYQQNIVEKIQSIRESSTAGGGVVDRLTSAVERFRGELAQESGAEEAAPPPTEGRSREPVPVIIEPGAGSPIDVLRVVVGPLVSPLVTTGLVVVFVVFVLLERESLRDRFIKLAGAGDLQTSTEALTDAGRRVSRYLLMQLIVNVTYGVPIGLGLYFIGVPNAVLWGLLAVVLRFIPYLGPFLAALFPITLAFAVDPGWSMLLWVIGLFLAMELLSNNVVEPMLYGTSTGLSPLAIISAAIFWTILWGPVGLVLSTSLTVCLMVMGRYVPSLQFLGVLLGREQVLTREEQLYQRLLATNAEAAVELAENYVDEQSSAAFYDEVAIPTLLMAEHDRQRNASGGSYRGSIADGMVGVVREVADHVGQGKAAGDRASAEQAASVPRAIGTPDLCIGGRTDLDWAAAEMVAQVIAERGIQSRVLPPIAISQHGIGQLDLAGVEVVCLSYLAAEPKAAARFACRRLKRRSPTVKIVVCLWHPSAGSGNTTEFSQQTGADAVVSTVEAAAAQIDAWVAPHIADPMQPAPIPENERDRIAALRSLGLVTGESEVFDEVAAKLAAAFGTAIALVTVVDEDHQHWPGAAGLPPKLDACRFDGRDTSICGHVVALDDLLVVEDVAKDPRFANNPFLIEYGVRAYAGAPLRTSSGHVIGSLCVIHTAPREFSEQDRNILRKVADDLMIRVEAECTGNQGAGPVVSETKPADKTVRAHRREEAPR